MIGSDQIEYEKSDSPREIRRFARQVMLIPKELAKEMEKVEDDRSTAYVPPDLFSSNQEIKKVFKRDQVVVESSLYEKGHEPQARVEKEKSV
uniref:Uncharacterized protein n=1 Tax=Acrobeloides nanus TaxID=290746 RepID=A0A914D7V1_9BILA